MNPARAALRARLREHRRAVPAVQAQAAARAVARRLWRLAVFRRARHVGIYLAADGELDLAPLIAVATRAGKRLYLPVLAPGGPRLGFHPWRPGDALVAGAHRIPVPAAPRGPRRPVQALDLVLLPVVGFDRHGTRLGRGGGHYDRSLAAVRSAARRPLLVGIAYECQRTAELARAPWDVPLDGVVTEWRVWRIARRFL